jgi:ArsR family transcriptional regulator
VLPAEVRLPAEVAAVLAQDLRLLADPIRLQILDILAARGGDVCVCDLEAALPVKQPTVSHHLRLLHRAGIVSVARKGLWAYYRLVPDALETRRSRLQSFLHTLAADGASRQALEVLNESRVSG